MGRKKGINNAIMNNPNDGGGICACRGGRRGGDVERVLAAHQVKIEDRASTRPTRGDKQTGGETNPIREIRLLESESD